jgi:hypothetical protein
MKIIAFLLKNSFSICKVKKGKLEKLTILSSCLSLSIDGDSKFVFLSLSLGLGLGSMLLSLGLSLGNNKGLSDDRGTRLLGLGADGRLARLLGRA